MSIACKPVAVALALSLFAASAAWADNLCQVTFSQAGVKLEPVMRGPWAMVQLEKAPFEVSVSPAQCSPLIATLTNQATIVEVSKLPERVFAGDGYGMAGAPEDADVLHWPSRAEIRSSLRELTTDWKEIEAYKAEASRLGYELPVVRTFGSGLVFRATPDSTTASFRRLSQAIPLSQVMSGLTLPAVIYLNEKDLLKPSWQDAVAPYHLRRPYRVLFVFDASQPAPPHAAVNEK